MEFAEYLAYERLWPWEYSATDYWGSVHASLLANANRDSKKKRKAYEPKDFLPKFLQPKPPEPEEIQEKLLTWAKNLKMMFQK